MSIADKITRLQAAKEAIAAAITSKGGTVASGDGYESFASDIASIPSGGGSEVERKDVNFVDYTGKVLASYTLAEASSITDYPTHPSHEGLINDGWSRPLSFVNALDYPLDIVARYRVTDDKLHIFYDATYRRICDFKNLVTNKAVTFTIDWGDGSTPDSVNVSANRKLIANHTYTSGGVKEIKVSTSDTTIQAMPSMDGNVNGILSFKCSISIDTIYLPFWVVLGQNDGSYTTSPFGEVKYLLIDSRCVFGPNVNGLLSSSRLVVADVGGRGVPDAITAHKGLFNNTTYGNSLHSIDYPDLPYDSADVAATYIVPISPDIDYIHFPESFEYFHTNALWTNSMARVLDFPSSVKSLGMAFMNCHHLSTIICRAIVPPTLAANAFANAVNTLRGANEFKIKVPSESVNAYKTADNWSLYADYIEAI